MKEGTHHEHKTQNKGNCPYYLLMSGEYVVGNMLIIEMIYRWLNQAVDLHEIVKQSLFK